ncbi:peptidyl-prolyl cis-trans isomerase FKBP4-like [Ptychodera flava]|uniref:peptidyl-prolyl cis-trans isomerase FKBP4-like n=1 Tax=Ptychodera flava TaxID=63121 RepID=UPI00396A0BCF
MADVEEKAEQMDTSGSSESSGQSTDSGEAQPHPMAGKGEDVTPNKDGGVLKTIITEGSGTETPIKGDHVEVHYVGTLLDGTKFDSSRDRGEKFSFTLGEGQVIKAWDMGVATMKLGEVCVITCKPEYAYGKRAQGKIPANSTLVFEVELFSFEGEDLTEDKDKGILRRILEEGEGYQNPNEDATVEVHITGKFEGNTFEDRDVKFIIGEGGDQGIVLGLEIALQKMKKGEKASLVLAPKYAFGKDGKAEFNVPGNATVNYEVRLKDFEKAKESWEMNLDEKLTESEAAKAKGTEYFKAGNFVRAVKQYKRIVDFLESESETDMEPSKWQKKEKILLAAHLNLAMCYLKLSEEVEALHSCDKAIEMDSKSEKGFFRRGMARLNLGDHQEAEADFKKVLELEPNNKAAKHQLAVVRQKIKAQKDKDKRIYGNMFAKFAEQDAKAEARKKAEAANKMDKVFEKATNGEKEDEDLAMEGDDEEEEEVSENTPEAVKA